MLFLIDYENVGNAGMKGYEYLEAQDHVILFYSEARKNMERRILDKIAASGCTFEVCKLCKTGKNALDFYIASRLGELIGAGCDKIPVIISHDGGFRAVRDFWGKRAPHKKTVLLYPSIEDGIVNSSENSQRIKELRQLRINSNIGRYYDTYSEKKRIKAVLEKLFAGTEYEGITDEIQNLIEGKKKTPKVIYLNSLHLFGRKNGLEIYNKLKACDDL